MATARTHLLLRNVLVDSEPFHEILHTYMDVSSSSVEQRYDYIVLLPVVGVSRTTRLSGISRLFRIVSDVTSPAFSVEGRQWRSSVIEIFYVFFSTMWMDSSVRSSLRADIPRSQPVHRRK